jgi:hypothetical protein
MEPKDDLERAAANQSASVLSEWVFYLRTSGKWWVLPIALVLAVLGLFLLLSASPLGPFIYTLF